MVVLKSNIDHFTDELGFIPRIQVNPIFLYDERNVEDGFSIEINEFDYIRAYNSAMSIKGSYSRVMRFIKAEDFSGYRAFLKLSDFNNIEEAEDMVLSFVQAECGITLKREERSGIKSSLVQHGYRYNKELADGIRDTIFQPENSDIYEFQIPYGARIEYTLSKMFITALNKIKYVNIRVKF